MGGARKSLWRRGFLWIAPKTGRGRPGCAYTLRLFLKPPEAPVSDRLAVLPQYLLPKQALTQLAGSLARRQAGALTTWAIRRFIARYGVDMAEAANPDPAAYASFNDLDRKSTRLNSSHSQQSRMPSSA